MRREDRRYVTLSRRDLEEHRMRELYMAAVDPKGTLSDEALAASLASTLARRPPGAGWWVFAYGSLLWNPLFPFLEARPATLRGVHRSFCLWSKASRGTTEQPGLVLGLEPGGACRGVGVSFAAARGKGRAGACYGGGRWSSAPIGRDGCGRAPARAR